MRATVFRWRARNYLVPIDAKLEEEVDLHLEAFELDAFLDQMRSGANLVFLDACRDNPLALGLARSMGASRSAAIGRGLGRVERARGTLIGYATQPGNVADDGDGRNSPFTGALLAHITTPGMSVNDMLTAVTDAVVTHTDGRQQPWTHSSLRKPFYFKSQPEPEPAPTPPTTDAQASPSPAVGESEALRALAEREFWVSVKDSGHAADIEAYLERYPRGTYETLARNRITRLQAAPEETGAPQAEDAPAPDDAAVSGRLEAERLAAEREFWASVKDSQNPDELQAYLDRYPQGAYAVLARGRLSRLAVTPDGAEATMQASSEEPEAAPSVAVSAPTEPAAPDLAREDRRWVQIGLAALGFEPGPADGLFGPKSRVALGA